MKQLICCALFLICSRLSAQHASLFIQSADQFGLENPAGLSFEEMANKGLHISGQHRSQWIGFEGAPRTQAVSVTWNQRPQLLLGGSFLNDRIGATRQPGVVLRAAHTTLERLKIGVQTGFFSQSIDLASLDIFDDNDLQISDADGSSLYLNAGAGAFYSLWEPQILWRFFAGVAFNRNFVLSEPTTVPAENTLHLQGGLGYKDWVAGGRYRFGFDSPDGLDLYLRRYLLGRRLFAGANFSSDFEGRTAGVQAGVQTLLSKPNKNKNNYLNVSAGFSVPLGPYLRSNGPILDLRATLSLSRQERK